jgi:hypothetical protein
MVRIELLELIAPKIGFGQKLIKNVIDMRNGNRCEVG